LNGNWADSSGVYRADRADDLTWLATFDGTPCVALMKYNRPMISSAGFLLSIR
jgi:hypothetical protein